MLNFVLILRFLDAGSVVLHKAGADADKHHGNAEDGESYPGEKEFIPADYIREITEDGSSDRRRHIAEEIEKSRSA